MVSDLKLGILPEEYLLRKRFEAAIIKKMGVLRIPYSFWPTDTKINPPAKQLLWAAILLHDIENCKILEAIISTELEEKQWAKGQPGDPHDLGIKIQILLNDYIKEFIELGPDENFRDDLRRGINELFPERLNLKI